MSAAKPGNREVTPELERRILYWLKSSDHLSVCGVAKRLGVNYQDVKDVAAKYAVELNLLRDRRTP